MNDIHVLSCLPHLSSLPPETLAALSAGLVEEHLPAGEVLYRQGDPGDDFYIVTSGKLSLHQRQPGGAAIPVRDLGPGDCVGEMALLTGQPRTATVTAAEDTRLLRLPKPAFDRLVEDHPALMAELAGQLQPSFRQTRARLIVSRLFGPLDEARLSAILEKLEWRQLDSGQVLCREGEPGDEMYIVVQGRLRYAVAEAGGSRDLGEVGAGESIGEFALLSESGTPESRRSATVYATRQTDMLVLTRPVFETLVCQSPQALLRLTRRIVRRELRMIQATTPRISAQVIAVLPVRPDEALGELARQLADSLGALGSTLYLNPERFDELYGKPGAAQTRLDHPASLVINTWLDERESEHQYRM